MKPKKITQAINKTYSISETPPVFRSKEIKDTLPPIKGILLKHIQPDRHIFLTHGGIAQAIQYEDLYKGVEIYLPADSIYGSHCEQKKLTFGIKDDRLYVSVEFKYLQTEETIGIIEFNHWMLYREYVLRFSNDDERLEVRDFQENIVFSISYSSDQHQFMVDNRPTDHVRISGYFVTPSSVVVVGNHRSKDARNKKIITNNYYCFSKSDSNWKRKAWSEIEKITSIFK